MDIVFLLICKWEITPETLLYIRRLVRSLNEITVTGRGKKYHILYEASLSDTKLFQRGSPLAISTSSLKSKMAAKREFFHSEI
jgi:hypothetical protein